MIRPQVKKWLPVATLVLLTGLAYANSLDNAFVSDDLEAIARNPHLGSWSYVLLNPLTIVRSLFYNFAYWAGGRNPLPFHLLNISFHLGCVLLLYQIMKKVSTFTTALVAASLLAVHPLQAEAVTWISGGPYSQSAFFLLLAFYLYLKAENRKAWLIISNLSYLVALLSSEKSFIFPLILTVWEISRHRLRQSWPYLVSYYLFSFGEGCYLLSQINRRISDLQNIHYEQPVFNNSLRQIPVSISSYLQLIFWPYGYTLYHTEMDFSPLQYGTRVVVTVILLGLIAFSYKKNSLAFFWLAFFVLALVPTLLPWSYSWIVAERYAYLAAIGIYAAVALASQKVWERLPPKIFWAGLSLILLLLTAQTIRRNQDWQDEDHLWLAAARTSPSSHQNHNNLGDYYTRHGDLEMAAREFQTAISLKPNYADAYHNLGNTYHALGRDQEAVDCYLQAIKYGPRLWQSRQNLAALYFTAGEVAKAKDELEEAVRLNPDNSTLHSNLGAVYLELNFRESAEAEFRTALLLDNRNIYAQRGLEMLGKN